MAISSFQRPAASSGSTSKTVSNSNGTFTIDPGEADSFYLDFNDSYFNQPTGTIAPQFVGAYRTSSSNGSMTLSFSALNVQGIGSSVQIGDHVFVVVSVSDTSEARDEQTLSAPYPGGSWTLLAGGGGNDSRDLYTNVYYTKIEDTPASTVTVDADLDEDGASLSIAYVIRNGFYNGNINQDSITDTAEPNPPSINTVKDNSMVLAIGTATDDGNLSSPGGGLTDFVNMSLDRDDGLTGAIAHLSTTTAGVYDPPQFINSRSSSSDATVSFSIEIEEEGIYNNAATINFDNISDQEVKDCFVYLYMDRPAGAGDLSLTWDARTASIATSPIPSTLANGIAQSYDFFAYNDSVFLYEKSIKPKIQKTEFIKATTSWTAPSDVAEVEILICGGGGSAGDDSADGGGGGSAFEDVLQVTPGQSYTITIGAGASGSTTGSGQTGSSSSFGSLFTAAGGEGGSGGRGGYGAGLGGHGASTSTTSPDSFSAHGEGLRGYGRGGTIGNEANGAPSSGQGGSGISGTSANGGSGICIIKYWTAT